jgi:hypothetical protein
VKNEIVAYFIAAVFAAGLARFLPSPIPPAPGAVRGVVTDPSGAAVPGAAVTVTGPRVAQTLVTGRDGEFEAPGLAPGHYSVTVRAEGFAGLRERGLVVASGLETEADARLAIRPVSQAITVSVSSRRPPR